MSNSNLHVHDDIPLVLVGGASGAKTAFSRHLVFKGQPTGNLHLALLDKLGIETNKFCDSTHRVTLES